MTTVFALLAAALYIYPAWKISQKCGYPGWLGLLVVIPLANLVWLYFLAFADWPVLQGLPRLVREDEPPEG